MLIRCKGYNSGVKEYLEEGQKSGRELSRDELDERVILDGNLDLTEMVYKSIPDKGQDRYLTFTLSFKEEQVDEEMLSSITQEFKSFLMKAYSPDEFNFYAEAHLPKIKTMKDRKTGGLVDRKPHIHIVIPRKNLVSGNEMNPVGNYKQNEKYLEAFQEYINQKYKIESPRDNMRATPTSYADMLSRYKGDDFRAKNKAFKSEVLQRVYDEGVQSRKGFYEIVSQYGETKIRNAGKPSEYIAVKLKGDQKFTNLKETIFSDDFIIHRRVTKPPLEQHIIKDRFSEWNRRSEEIKYIDKISSKRLRDKYYASNDEVKSKLMHSCIHDFNLKHRGSNVLRSEWQTNNERSAFKTERGFAPRTTNSLQNMRDGNVASSRSREGDKVLLPGDARILMGNKQAVRDLGLRRTLSDGGGRGRVASSTNVEPGKTRVRTRPLAGNGKRSRGLQLTPYPAIPRFKNRIPTLADVNKRSSFIFSAGTITGNKSKTVFSKPTNADVNSSSLSAWLIRRINDNSPRKNVNKLLRVIEQDFHDIRREVLSDKRFSDEEKNQLVSVIHFERLKRKEAAFNKYEDYIMGSKEIRELMGSNNKKVSGFTISAPEPEENQGAKSRFARVMDKIRNPVEYSKVADESRKSVEKQLDASNLYTKRTRKGHVHYLDKTSDKTLFVDTGKLITMRKNGLSTDSVAIALELAQGRFGSTLNIKGSKEFKEMVVNVVAEKGLDIHFTDKKMNQMLEQRRQELAKRDVPDNGTAFTIEAGEPQQAVAKNDNKNIQPSSDQEQPLQQPVQQQPQAQTQRTADEIRTIVEDPGLRRMAMSDEQKRREFQATPETYHAVYKEISAEIADRLQKSVQQPQARTADEVRTIVEDPGLRRMAMSDEQKRREFQATPETYDAVYKNISAEIASRLQNPGQAQQAIPRNEPIVGKIMKHGAAPYQNKEGNSQSYYVVLKGKDGLESTQWGVGLKDALKGFRRGQEVALDLKESKPVQVRTRDENGNISTRDVVRNVWEATKLSSSPSSKASKKTGLDSNTNEPDLA
ncbi:LPD7 domain-containing protein [Serratia quinivorans]|uniref:LPD7 domain-containing protein n=1 Tax=Serratia quinivorans TaxID=137545 RepID=UPI003F994470